MTQSEAAVLTGGCQCGAVRYRFTGPVGRASICHCRMCQKAVGNLFAALVAVPVKSFEWTRGRPGVFMSSEQVARGFCRDCGTPLFYHPVNKPRIGVAIGSLDAPDRVAPRYQFGNEARLPYIHLLPDLEGAETTTEGDDPQFAAAIAGSNHQHPDHDTETWTPHPSSTHE